MACDLCGETHEGDCSPKAILERALESAWSIVAYEWEKTRGIDAAPSQTMRRIQAALAWLNKPEALS